MLMRLLRTLLSTLLPATTVTQRTIIRGDLSGGNANANGLRGNGERITCEKPVGPFDRVRVGDIFEVHARVGETPSVTLTADSNLLDRVHVEVVAGCLVCAIEGVLSTDTPVRLDIVAPVWRAVEVRGAARLTLEGVAAEALKLTVADAGCARVHGALTSLEVVARDAATANCTLTQTEHLTVRASEAATVLARASQSAKVRVSDAASFKGVGGAPAQCTLKTADAASARFKKESF